MEVICGATAEIVQVVALYPLDTLKVRGFCKECASMSSTVTYSMICWLQCSMA